MAADVTITWDAGSGYTPTGFVVQRSIDGEAWDTKDTVASNVFTYVDTPVDDGVYYYRVGATTADYGTVYGSPVMHTIACTPT